MEQQRYTLIQQVALTPFIVIYFLEQKKVLNKKRVLNKLFYPQSFVSLQNPVTT